MGIEANRSCTSVLVGRAATRDGSVIIARNEDNTSPNLAKNFRVVAAGERDGATFESPETGFSTVLPEGGLRYTAMPDVDTSGGLYEEAGVNSAHVAMSATESAYANDLVLAHDPFVADGLAEDAMVTVVLPYIRTAREGVRLLGSIVEQRGAAEANGVLFADRLEAWYMEIATGHHWVAQRIPDDCYAVVANQIAIQEVDFESDDFMSSRGIREFVDAHALNPHPDSFDFRRIFGTATEQDLHYNTPRVWDGQRILTPSAVQAPESFDLPFIRRADFKIGVEDVARVLSSHFDLTEFDPLGRRGDAKSRTRYRAIALSRTQESHIIQMPPVTAQGAASLQGAANSQGAGTEALAPSPVCWTAVGTPGFSPYLPLFTDVDAWPKQLDGARYTEPDLDNAYWLFRSIQALSDARFGVTERLVRSFSSAQRQKMHAHLLKERANEASQETREGRNACLRLANERLLEEAMADAHVQLGSLMKALAQASPLSFTMDSNL